MAQNQRPIFEFSNLADPCTRQDTGRCFLLLGFPALGEREGFRGSSEGRRASGQTPGVTPANPRPPRSSRVPQTRHLPPGLHRLLPRDHPGCHLLGWTPRPPARRPFLSQCCLSPLTDASRAPALSVCLFWSVSLTSVRASRAGMHSRCSWLHPLSRLHAWHGQDTCQLKARTSLLEPKKEAELTGANFEMGGWRKGWGKAPEHP